MARFKLTGGGNGNGENSAVSAVAIGGGDAAGVLLHDSGNDVQASTGAGTASFGGDVGAEDARQQINRDAWAVVGNRDAKNAFELLRFNINAAWLLHDLRGVEKEIQENALPIFG